MTVQISEAGLRYIAQPTVVLSAEQEVIATNDGFERLLGGGPAKRIADNLIGRSILSLGIALVPEKKPVYRDWGSLLEAAAAHLSTCASSPIGGLERQHPHDDRPESREGENPETTRFWESELLLEPREEIDVLILRGASQPTNARQGGSTQTSSTIRARLCVRALVQDEAMIYLLTFQPPSADTFPSTRANSIDFGKQRPIPSMQLPDLSGNTSAEFKSDHSKDAQNGDVHQLISKLIPHIMGLLDADGQVLFLSQSWYDFTGLDEAQSFGSGWTQVIHPEDVGAILVAWADVIKTGKEHWTWESRYRKYDGTYCYFLIRAQPVKDESGKVIRWYASMIDVNEYVLARQAADRRRQSILTLLSQADVTLWGINQAHEIFIREGNLPWDPSLVLRPIESTVLNRSETRGGLRHSENQQDVSGATWSVLNGLSLFQALEHKQGDRWYRTTIVADHEYGVRKPGAGPTVQAAMGLTIDVTDVKARASLQIDNERLMTNERIATEASNLKSRFLANMSHEIRTPIAGVIGLGDLLSESALSQEQEEWVRGIQDSAGFLLTLINDILDFSKIESGHMDLEEVRFRPHRIVNDLNKLMDIYAKRGGLALVYRNSIPERTTVVGDPGRLRQILTNLLSNAIKFTKKGSVTLTVEAMPFQSPHNNPNQDDSAPRAHPTAPGSDSESDIVMLQFSVKDTGCGIDDETMRRLFKPFTQADSSTARKHGGTGLGLTISKELVEMMGGSLQLTSNPSVGSVATFRIPYKRVSLKRKENASPAASVSVPTSHASLYQPLTEQESFSKAPDTLSDPGTENSISEPAPASPRPLLLSHRSNSEIINLSPAARACIHILVVEDNPVNQKILSTTLSKLGFSVSAVWNGEEALAYLSTPASCRRPKLILMDCMMPVMDGYTATHIIRHDVVRFDESVRRMPIIAMTASAIRGDKERCEQAGMDDYLSKPVTRDTLERVLLQWVSVGREGGDPD